MGPDHYHPLRNLSYLFASEKGLHRGCREGLVEELQPASIVEILERCGLTSIGMVSQVVKPIPASSPGNQGVHTPSPPPDCGSLESLKGSTRERKQAGIWLILLSVPVIV